MRQAMIWTNPDPVYWRIFATLGGEELQYEDAPQWFCGLKFQRISDWTKWQPFRKISNSFSSMKIIEFWPTESHWRFFTGEVPTDIFLDVKKLSNKQPFSLLSGHHWSSLNSWRPRQPPFCNFTDDFYKLIVLYKNRIVFAQICSQGSD